MAGEEWLDVDETSRYLNLPNRTIRRRIFAGDFAAVGSPARIRRRTSTTSWAGAASSQGSWST
ncbi:MAG: helix-turn-helix domain-containing protein [Actinomycetota bacterium]|nr:helix-turn-helix domain-containing protein [Actinomycetota bacterium]